MKTQLGEFGGLAPIVWMDRNFPSLCVDVAALDKYPRSEPDGHNDAGIYFLWDINGSLLYVGKSVEISRRMWKHIEDGAIPFAAFSYMPVRGHHLGKLFMLEIETCYILALEPTHNAQFRPGRQDGWAAALRTMIAKKSAEVIAQKRPPFVRVVRVDGAPD